MDALLNTSWSLHFISVNNGSYRKLFDPSTTQAHLSRHFDRLQHFLSSQRPRYTDDLNDENEKLGPFRECRSSIISLPRSAPASSVRQHSSQTSTLIQINLIYQNTTFTVLLYTPYLILSKAPTIQTKHFTTFLSDTFNISTSPLKLPSSLLGITLQTYISTLTSTYDGQIHGESNGDTDHLEPEKRAAILRAALGTLKLTISFSGPVAPHLKTLDLSVPYETVNVLLSSSSTPDRTFMRCLTDHLHRQTGLKLPLADGDWGGDEHAAKGRAGSVSSDAVAGPPLRLSKMAAAAFAVSVEGKLRFAAKAIENALGYEDVVTAANLGLLNDILAEARRRGTTE